jgi:formyltetrahydrofolate deformylase
VLRIADFVPLTATRRPDRHPYGSRPPEVVIVLPTSAQSNSATAPAGDFVLILSCADRPGIVHAVSGFLVQHGGNILESQQFNDQLVDRFFMRIDFVVDGSGDGVDAATLRAAFEPIAKEFGMDYELWDAAAPYRTLIMVSKHLHCLNDLLFRTSTGSLQIEVPAVVSNHPDAGPLAASYGVPFHHVPVTPDTKAEAEAEVLRLVKEHDVDLVVLARYMQVLSDETCRALSGKAINIHHSFLPSFKGARPYHQAFDRGVKLVGATAHYVTSDLDEGPIIEQDVIRVDHGYDQDQLVSAGRDVEAQVLSRAVRWHSQSRVFLNGHRTVVFR